MVIRSNSRHEIAALLLTASIVVFLLLLVVVPAHSQAPMPPPRAGVELMEENTQVPQIMLDMLIIEFLFLTGMMISYLVASWQHTARQRLTHHHHWWNRLHTPH